MVTANWERPATRSSPVAPTAEWSIREIRALDTVAERFEPYRLRYEDHREFSCFQHFNASKLEMAASIPYRFHAIPSTMSRARCSAELRSDHEHPVQSMLTTKLADAPPADARKYRVARWYEARDKTAYRHDTSELRRRWPQ